MQSDAAAAESNPPPACVKGMRRDEGAALAYFAQAAGDCQNAVSELSSQSYAVAIADLKAAARAENAGGTKITAIDGDLEATFAKANG
jgi:hypothetical protein